MPRPQFATSITADPDYVHPTNAFDFERLAAGMCVPLDAADPLVRRAPAHDQGPPPDPRPPHVPGRPGLERRRLSPRRPPPSPPPCATRVCHVRIPNVASTFPVEVGRPGGRVPAPTLPGPTQRGSVTRLGE